MIPAYVRDIIYAPLRGGPSAEYRILHQGLKSGTRLEKLETNADSNFVRVKVEATDMEGWIHQQYLVAEPIARDHLKNEREAVQQAKTNLEAAQVQISTLEGQIAGLESDATNLIEQNSQLNQELSRITQLAADVININQKNLQLEQENKQLNQQMEEMTSAVQTLQDTTNQIWYGLGAGTIVAGIFLGFWIGRARKSTGTWE